MDLLVWIIVCSLVVSTGTLANEAIQIEDREDLLLKYEILQSQMENVMQVVQSLKETLIHNEDENRVLKTTLKQLGNKMAEYQNTLSDPTAIETSNRNLVARTCTEIRLSQPNSVSGMFWIDPDGPGVGETPIYVYCDMTRGTTAVEFDHAAETQVTGCNGAGCYSKAINYYAEMKQIEALIELSSECRQSFEYSCVDAPLHFGSTPYSWWTDRNGVSQFYWTGNNSSNPICDCGINTSCINPSFACNCDGLSAAQQTDTGIITDKSTLPITGVNFGLRAMAGAIGIYTLGRLECSGRTTVTGMPTSCRDLWVIGHTLNGFYSIRAENCIKSVYCDFNQPFSQASQIEVGSVDVKSSPVHFYVQRRSSLAGNGTVTFEQERLNVGGGMNLESGIFTAPKSGFYFFNFDGMKRIDNESPLYLNLYVNDVLIETTYAPVAPVYQHFSLSSHLRLQVGDQVKLVVTGPGIYDNESHYGGFTGMLLQEDLSFTP